LIHRRGPEIPRAFRRERRLQLLNDARRGLPIAILLAVGIGVVVLILGSPHRVVGSAYGRIAGIHHTQSETGRGARRMSVILERAIAFRLDFPQESCTEVALKSNF
jgi:hypothetical protein